MTTKEFISDKFKSFGIRLSEADLLEMTISLEDPRGEVTKGNLRIINIAICKFIPSLLARPTSISEGGMSTSWDKNAVKEYYSSLCKDLGLSNLLHPTVKFTRLK